jgi:hypothetical protein
MTNQPDLPPQPPSQAGGAAVALLIQALLARKARRGR